MWGFEMDVSKISISRVADPYRPEDRTTIYLRPALTIKRFRPLRQNIAPFLYQTLSAKITYNKFTHIDDRLQRTSFLDWSAGMGIGLGVAWFPWQRVSLSLRQGISLEFKQDDIATAALSNSPQDEPTTVKVLDNTFSLLIPSMRLLALFYF